MIMRFRPANISLINRRHYLPRLLLTLSSKRQKPPQPFEDVDRVTPYQFPDRRSLSNNSDFRKVATRILHRSQGRMTLEWCQTDYCMLFARNRRKASRMARPPPPLERLEAMWRHPRLFAKGLYIAALVGLIGGAVGQVSSTRN